MFSYLNVFVLCFNLILVMLFIICMFVETLILKYQLRLQLCLKVEILNAVICAPLIMCLSYYMCYASKYLYESYLSYLYVYVLFISRMIAKYA